jgi:RNA polymerase sigma factor (sigma-70 family)
MIKTKVNTEIELIETILNPASSRAQINQAYSVLYKKYSPIIKSVINNVVQSCDVFDKEEILALTMSKAFTHLQQYRPEYPFSVWIKSIARNNAIDYFRKKKLNISSLENIEIENTNSPDVILEAKETGNLIQKFIKEQKESYREILRLRLEFGLSCKAIASRMHIPVGTISTILFRSRILLKKSRMFKD